MDEKHICTALLRSQLIPHGHRWNLLALGVVVLVTESHLYIFAMFYKRLDDENKRNFFSSHEPECISKHCQILNNSTRIYYRLPTRSAIKFRTDERGR